MTDQTPTPAHRGPGRPRKPTAPRTEQQAALAEALAATEVRLDAASRAFAETDTVAAELEMYLARIGVASAWAGYLRAQGNHTHALKYGEEEARFARAAAGLREVLVFDRLNERDKQAKTGAAAGALGKRKPRSP